MCNPAIPRELLWRVWTDPLTDFLTYQGTGSVAHGVLIQTTVRRLIYEARLS
jgi:hypothetical protein